MPKDLYEQIREALSAFLELLRKLDGEPGPIEEKELQKRLSKMQRCSAKIGGQMHYGVELLKSKLDHLFSSKYNKEKLNELFQHALLLDQQTREL